MPPRGKLCMTLWWEKEGYVIVVNKKKGMHWITLGEFPDATPRTAKSRKTIQTYVDVVLSIPKPKIETFFWIKWTITKILVRTLSP